MPARFGIGFSKRFWTSAAHMPYFSRGQLSGQLSKMGRLKPTQGIHCGSMPPLVFSWPYGPIFLAVMFWAFAPEFRIISRQSEPASCAAEAGSKRAIAVGQGLAMLAAFAIAAGVPAGQAPYPFPLFLAGGAHDVAGSLLL